jgi:hypothetical protein
LGIDIEGEKIDELMNDYYLVIDIEGEKIDKLMRCEWGKLWVVNWVFFFATKYFVVI